VTRAERLKLAKAARELASEFAEGRGPKLRGMDYCGCALGLMFKHAGIPNGHKGDPAYFLERDFLRSAMISDATLHEIGTAYTEHIPGAVVFPLLWAADELESR
jgi:hypothetical protein